MKKIYQIGFWTLLLGFFLGGGILIGKNIGGNRGRIVEEIDDESTMEQVD